MIAVLVNHPNPDYSLLQQFSADEKVWVYFYGEGLDAPAPQLKPNWSAAHCPSSAARRNLSPTYMRLTLTAWFDILPSAQRLVQL